MKTFREFLNEAVVPGALRTWADKKKFTIIATKTHKTDRTSMHFLAQDSKGDDREGILTNDGKVTLLNTVPDRRDWINAMV